MGGSSRLRESQANAVTYGVIIDYRVVYRLSCKADRVMHKYEIIIYWSNEDRVFVAEVPELPGRTAHGNTHEAALENINQAVHLWLETAGEFGDPIPKPKGERLMLA